MSRGVNAIRFPIVVRSMRERRGASMKCVVSKSRVPQNVRYVLVCVRMFADA
jgi:hypothetical protein